MRRHRAPERPDYRRTNATQGLTFDETLLSDGRTIPYWREGVFYDFTPAERDTLTRAGESLFHMYVEATEHVLDRCPQRPDVMARRAPDPATCAPAACPLSRMEIPAWMHEPIIISWENDVDVDAGEPSLTGDYSPMLYGRFDLAYDGAGPPTLYEYNADTPTGLIESALVQWQWLLDVGWKRLAARPPDQFNVLHDALVKGWRYKLDRLVAARPALGPWPLVHFAYYQPPGVAPGGYNPAAEDHNTVQYLAETARQAGFAVNVIPIQDIHHNTLDDRFYDPDGRHIDVCFKLYPWEWMWAEPFGKAAARGVRDPGGTCWIEPPYKGLWSHKGMLVVLWSLFGGHPEYGRFLLPTYFHGEQPDGLADYVCKPMVGREGANVRLVRGGHTVWANPGPYDDGGFVVQALRVAPDFGTPGPARHVVIGLWTVLDEIAGVGVRESAVGEGPIVNGESHFAPHTVGFAPQEVTR